MMAFKLYWVSLGLSFWYTHQVEDCHKDFCSHWGDKEIETPGPNYFKRPTTGKIPRDKDIFPIDTQNLWWALRMRLFKWDYCE